MALAIDMALASMSTKWPSNRYTLPMSTHSVAEAKNNLPELIGRALKGEGIVITLDGRPAVELKPVPQARPERRITKEDIEWLAAHRIERRKASIDSVTLVRQMRDEDDEL